MTQISIMHPFILIGLLSLLPLQAGADDHDDPADDAGTTRYEQLQDHQRARAARLRGEILPIAEILHHISEQVPGDVIDIELEDETLDGQRVWLYELKILTPDGRRLEVEIDARDGQILELEDDD
ncbi:PepSY domain-containing protein [Thiorhodovibrio frisius]|uniref:Peptidase propeptide domain-containing protein n=1 Tax=Thiorhodovibrio frisius TaxID=631362 RepID=H8Z5P9_9GAMM|nr:PepSY domain-containing protein [Thiorhodovibrio frisius]EIC19533.1 Peptidase propeptide domain-containing protein [Thiorhodovibrio frisius]WPL20504.1 Peptidase propeptide and YPEB domain protein [Thiorhodovibrio frisius]